MRWSFLHQPNRPLLPCFPRVSGNHICSRRRPGADAQPRAGRNRRAIPASAIVASALRYDARARHFVIEFFLVTSCNFLSRKALEIG
jgi:hypothetical protein